MSTTAAGNRPAVEEGHIAAFAEDPNCRAFTKATSLSFMNAVSWGRRTEQPQ
jgi:hypothetical protein